MPYERECLLWLKSCSKNHMKFPFIILIACCSFIRIASGQKLVSAVDNTITVFSRNAPAGNTDVIEVSLPANTRSYVYRISIFKKDQWIAGPSLAVLLDSMGARKVSQATDFRQFAVSNNDNTIASAFIFTNPNDADHFYHNKPGSRACKNLQRITSTCLSSNQCLGKKLYFGFSNGNAADEIDVRLEVVGVVE